MDRRKFIQHSCICGLTGFSATELLSGCAAVKYTSGTIRGSDLLIPIEDFIDKNGDNVQYRKYIITSNEILKFPICVFRFSNTDYSALWTECTHQGNELQVFGEKLVCPAHGSEFDSRGQVREGPADKSLRIFPLKIEGDYLKISLKK
jgi:Rieske Fe-S protein